MIPPAILLDADNTLWDTDAVFANAQLALLEAVRRDVAASLPNAPLAFVRGLDQAIARLHTRGLRYPPGLLAHALALGLDGVPPTEAARRVLADRPPGSAGLDVQGAIAAFSAALEAPADLLPGVVEGLDVLTGRGIVPWILTEGDGARAQARLAALGLAGRMAGVIEARKDWAEFDRLRCRFAPARIVMIGDQPDRDIRPARQAGCLAVLVPSRFRPEWHAPASWSEADAVVDRFDDAIAWVLERGQSRPSADRMTHATPP